MKILPFPRLLKQTEYEGVWMYMSMKAYGCIKISKRMDVYEYEGVWMYKNIKAHGCV